MPVSRCDHHCLREEVSNPTAPHDCVPIGKACERLCFQCCLSSIVVRLLLTFASVYNGLRCCCICPLCALGVFYWMALQNGLKTDEESLIQ